MNWLQIEQLQTVAQRIQFAAIKIQPDLYLTPGFDKLQRFVLIQQVILGGKNTASDDLIMDITHEMNIITVINTHDMNSVMQIGEKIVFFHEGRLEWTGTKEEVLSSKNEILEGFIFASPFLQKLRAQINI